MHRFFTNDISQDGVARILGDDLHHLARVLRLHKGDAVELCDGNGADYDGVLVSVTEREALCRATNARPSPAEPRCRVTLVQALPKAGKMELIVQKCVELGVCAVQPALSARCVPVPGNDFEKKRARYQRISDEAAKQARRGILPQVLPLAPLDALDLAAFDAVFVAYEEERAVTLKRALRERGPFASAAAIVGPEGGFEPGEIERLRFRGAIVVSLGRTILRTETAGLAMLANLLYEAEQ